MEKSQNRPKVIVICGPTGVGKTTTAIEIAKVFNGEIVGADSMQIYRYMDIGTAKPTADERDRIAHHMIDIIDPNEHFDAVQYSRLARAKIAALHDRGITPFVVGGTGLYIKSLLHGMFHSGSTRAGFRKRLKKQAEELGSDILYQRLQKCDPSTAQKLHPHDTYRIIRALETYEATGRPISEHHHDHGFSEELFVTLKIGLNLPREQLYNRINDRVDAMLAAGFVDEVKKLRDMGYGPDIKSMQSIGYRHMLAYLNGSLSWDECVRTLKRDHRRYAKRQMTWFGKDDEIIWRKPRQLEEIIAHIRKFLKKV